jgi:hypothetical protein
MEAGVGDKSTAVDAPMECRFFTIQRFDSKQNPVVPDTLGYVTQREAPTKHEIDSINHERLSRVGSTVYHVEAWPKFEL